MRDLRAARAGGFSLVELMVAMTLGLVLLGGVISLVMNSQQTTLATESRSRLQDNLRFAADRLRTDIRHANYKGCQHDAALVHPLTLAALLPISGQDGGGTAPDRLWLVYRAPGSAMISLIAGDEVTVSAPNALRAFDAVALEDCAGNWVEMQVSSIVRDATTDVLTMTSNVPTVLTAPGAVHLLAREDAAVPNTSPETAGSTVGATEVDDDVDNDTLISNLYFLHDGVLWLMRDAVAADLTRAAADMVPSAGAFSTPATGQAIPLIGQQVNNAAGSFDRNLEQRVESFQVLYGVDTSAPADGIADAFVSADAVADWRNVVTVKAAILLATPEDLSLPVDTRTYPVLDVTIDPTDDRRVRKVVSISVEARNMREVL